MNVLFYNKFDSALSVSADVVVLDKNGEIFYIYNHGSTVRSTESFKMLERVYSNVLYKDYKVPVEVKKGAKIIMGIRSVTR